MSGSSRKLINPNVLRKKNIVWCGKIPNDLQGSSFGYSTLSNLVPKIWLGGVIL
jgi:hypothetical protein